MKIINGLSSLLFIISFIDSNNSSKSSILWKSLNFLLIISSFLANSTNNNKFVFFDHVIIYVLSLCAINNNIINTYLIILCIGEYYFTCNIIFIKNISYICILFNYVILYQNAYYFRLNCGIYVFGIIIKLIRDAIYDKYNFILTLIWHICCVYYIYIFN